MKQYAIQCPGCCGEFFHTTGRYTDERPADGSMFSAVQSIVDAGWMTFPLFDSTMYLDISCPSCGTYLVDSLGYVIRKREIGEVEDANQTDNAELTSDDETAPGQDPQQDDGKVACPACGERYAAKGLHHHIKAKHPEYEG